VLNSEHAPPVFETNPKLSMSVRQTRGVRRSEDVKRSLHEVLSVQRPEPPTVETFGFSEWYLKDLNPAELRAAEEYLKEHGADLNTKTNKILRELLDKRMRATNSYLARHDIHPRQLTLRLYFEPRDNLLVDAYKRSPYYDKKIAQAEAEQFYQLDKAREEEKARVVYAENAEQRKAMARERREEKAWLERNAEKRRVREEAETERIGRDAYLRTQGRGKEADENIRRRAMKRRALEEAEKKGMETDAALRYQGFEEEAEKNERRRAEQWRVFEEAEKKGMGRDAYLQAEKRRIRAKERRVLEEAEKKGMETDAALRAQGRVVTATTTIEVVPRLPLELWNEIAKHIPGTIENVRVDYRIIYRSDHQRHTRHQEYWFTIQLTVPRNGWIQAVDSAGYYVASRPSPYGPVDVISYVREDLGEWFSRRLLESIEDKTSRLKGFPDQTRTQMRALIKMDDQQSNPMFHGDPPKAIKYRHQRGFGSMCTKLVLEFDLLSPLILSEVLRSIGETHSYGLLQIQTHESTIVEGLRTMFEPLIQEWLTCQNRRLKMDGAWMPVTGRIKSESRELHPGIQGAAAITRFEVARVDENELTGEKLHDLSREWC
jgi:hypothetical protein